MVKFHLKVIWHYDLNYLSLELLDKYVVSQIHWNPISYINLFTGFRENMS